MVTSINPTRVIASTRSEITIGSEAPSVMTYAIRTSGAAARIAAATPGTWLCRLPTTTGMPPRSIAVVGSCSSAEPASTWRLV